ncbi:sialate O-acetylesterase [Persicirhabdus sediminis]|uniref:Sialate O-acetylesterase domain-containing protein n=1 Tax=Persicirhabdus sediminis TaxID=454144 RepID=A0A8J7SG96_9BACT|nr:sialate O-acetylesterase [Persicirhabdus sediminis]MBK1789975.1 hypothetical protein [Persicirhabdus sediminis]
MNLSFRERACVWFILLAPLGQLAAAPEELLINGDFEIGLAEDRDAPHFICEGWRRQLWKPETRKSWLTSGEFDTRLAKDNKAIVITWDATYVYQNFSVVAGEDYQFSVDFMNADSQDSRWEPAIRVVWFDGDNNSLGARQVVAKADNLAVPVQQWHNLSGTAVAPDGASYGQIQLGTEVRGEGPVFQRHFIDNASVAGIRGDGNLPVSFVSHPYTMRWDDVMELDTFSGSLNDWAEDPDGDKLTFKKLAGPSWLELQPDGSFSGEPKFTDRGDNEFVFQADDGRGSVATGTFILPVKGLLSFDHLFSDNMILQRDREIPVWGTSLPASEVTVQFANGEKIQTKADSKGSWSVTLPAQPINQGSELKLTSSGRELVLTNVKVGDVWFCSGQSNMQWGLANTDGGPEAISNAQHNDLHFVQTPKGLSGMKKEELEFQAEWLVASPDNLNNFSATAYYFGRMVQNQLDIPIGLIHSSIGGTQIENWAPSLTPEGTQIYYNAMVHPYTKMPIAGMIWYQGEANLNDGEHYVDKMQTLANDWRQVWGGDSFPLYFVQIAPYSYNRGADLLPELWLAQAKAAEVIENSSMVVINDVGDINDIHPLNKKPVGERLAQVALKNHYGQKDVCASGPVALSAHRLKGNVVVQFSEVADGLSTRDGKQPDWFELAGADGNFSLAKAKIEGDCVVLSAEGVESPEWVRFAWSERAEPNLVNSEMWPTSAFKLQVK